MGRGILCPFALYKSYKAFILFPIKYIQLIRYDRYLFQTPIRKYIWIAAAHRHITSPLQVSQNRDHQENRQIYDPAELFIHNPFPVIYRTFLCFIQYFLHDLSLSLLFDQYRGQYFQSAYHKITRSCNQYWSKTENSNEV